MAAMMRPYSNVYEVLKFLDTKYNHERAWVPLSADNIVLRYMDVG